MALIKIGLVNKAAKEVETGLLAVAVTAEEIGDKGKLKSAALKALDTALGGVLSALSVEAEFAGKSNTELSVHTHGKLPASRLMLLGVGPAKALDRDGARSAASRTVKAALRAKVETAALVFPFDVDAALVESAAEGAQLGAYRFDKYLSEKKPRRLTQLDLVLDRAPAKKEKDAIRLGTEIGDAVNFARDLVNEPSNAMTPTLLAAAAQDVASEGGLKIEVLERKDLVRLKMGMFLGVTQGSEEPPKLIHISWEPAKKTGNALALVGKAVTFDSGGLSLKPAGSMETMKSDMAGSAAVFAAMRVVAKLKPKFAVHAFVGACENMPSGTAQRPGDVVRARNGKTVEVLNTDAEGRLVLGDVISWAAEKKPAAIIDLATLTGACIVALGPYTTGLFSSDEKLAAEILDAAKAGGEDVWRMPMQENLQELIKSPIADLKNTGGRSGGAITAALFLKEFTAGIPWAHLDIAGPSHLDKEKGYEPRGGTGVGVRTLVELVRARMG